MIQYMKSAYDQASYTQEKLNQYTQKRGLPLRSSLALSSFKKILFIYLLLARWGFAAVQAFL